MAKLVSSLNLNREEVEEVGLNNRRDTSHGTHAKAMVFKSRVKKRADQGTKGIFGGRA